MRITISKTYSWLVVSVSVAFALSLIFYHNNIFYQESLSQTKYLASSPIPKKPTGSQNAWIELDMGINKNRLFAGDLGDGIYPLRVALDSAAEAGKFTYKVRRGNIYLLGGISGNWKIYKNGAAPNESLEKLTIAAQDKYLLRLEK